MNASDLSQIIKPVRERVVDASAVISHLLTDSRALGDASSSLFFAISTKRNTGCKYVEELYANGVRNFVVPRDLDDEMSNQLSRCERANFWFVKDVVAALQALAVYHRSKFGIPVVGITGSNGKTIVKDWLVQLMSPDRKVVSSPKSYNSQIGVPLSVWQMKKDDDLAIFEAGISESGEMIKLRPIINPTIGIFTNIGQAHDENFLTRYQKIAEKLQLFTHADVLIYCADHTDIHSSVCSQESLRDVARYTWGTSLENNVVLQSVVYEERSTRLCVKTGNVEGGIVIPFCDRASIENAMHCVTYMSYLGYPLEAIALRCAKLTPVEMRLELNEGINNCLLINDGYSLDINSLTIALDFVQHEKQHYNKTLILSDFSQTGMSESELYSQVAQLVMQRGVTKFIGIGDALIRNKSAFDGLESKFYLSTEDFLMQHSSSSFESETILLKGARVFHFENIAKILQRKSHETIMEVNLDALIHNLNFYRSRINPSTRLMAMVKASSYGAGKVEVASALQYNNVDYLTVAYSDEGVELRRNGITLPIMVMNPEEESFSDIIKYQLEPDIYSFRIFNSFSETVRAFGGDQFRYPVHIELDTGMHRLGFSGSDVAGLVSQLGDRRNVLDVKSVFSHLACSEDSDMDDFTNGQIAKFRTWSSELKQGLGNPKILCHILNSSGITRFPEAQMDMVRLGIGLYGISPESDIQAQLTPVSRLKTKVSQVKSIPAGESVGYNRRWVASRDSRIAIIPIGYADGLNRHLGYGNGTVLVHGKEAPIIGSICMDMCFIDVTDIACNETDEVVIFGDAPLLHKISQAAGTIPYEILTSVAPRVKRVYYHE